MKTVHIYTDGACRGNPGPGGWGVVLRYDAHEKHLSGYMAETTNNRMELMAVIEGLKALREACDIDVTTDSQYVRKGITEWIEQWKRRGWKTSNKKPVKNRDLWEALDAEVLRHHAVRWHWVKGHSGHPENELADQLATTAIDHEQLG